jgi:poly(3-hydroxybutyrate) depolymerase
MLRVSRFITIVFIVAEFFPGTLHSQTVDEIFNRFIKRYHSYQSITIPYYTFVPALYDSQTRYPLVLCLHGVGECGDSPSAVKNNSLATVWARDSNQARWPCFILVPQCPSGLSWTYQEIMLSVNEIIDSLLLATSIDTNRLYVTGLSMGGFGTWGMIASYPNRFAAAIPMSGGGDVSTATLIKHIPIWDFHGAKDATVSVTYSRHMMSALENAGDAVVYTNCHNGDCTGLPDSVVAYEIANGAKHLYTEYESGGHVIWDQAYNTPLLLPWVFSQSGSQVQTGTERPSFASLPARSTLSQNYPNPFNPKTVISYQLPINSYLTLKIYDMLGREVATLFDGVRQAGNYVVTFDGSGLASGVYFYRMRAEKFVETKKLVLLR